MSNYILIRIKKFSSYKSVRLYIFNISYMYSKIRCNGYCSCRPLSIHAQGKKSIKNQNTYSLQTLCSIRVVLKIRFSHFFKKKWLGLAWLTRSQRHAWYCISKLNRIDRQTSSLPLYLCYCGYGTTTTRQSALCTHGSGKSHGPNELAA